jgi:hypothetical protein
MLAGYLMMAMLLAFASAGTAAFLDFSIAGLILAYMLGGTLGLLLVLRLATFAPTRAEKTGAMGPIGVGSGNTVGS